MQILPINFSNFYVNKKSLNKFHQKSFQLPNDSFEKTAQISFGSNKNIEKTKKSEFLKDLAALGVVGAPFLLALAASSHVMSKQNPEDIFLPDGTYLINVNDFSIKSNKISADADDGIFEVKGTGIKINADDYDFADISKGIYKNYDKSVDIDLLKNKYIDVNNGIFIDPENNISAIQIDDKLVPITVPAFGTSMDPADHSNPYYYIPKSMDAIREHFETHRAATLEVGDKQGVICNIHKNDFDIFAKLSQNPDFRPENDAHFRNVVMYLNNNGILEKQYKELDYVKEIISEESTFLTTIKNYFIEPTIVNNSVKYDILGRKLYTFEDSDGNKVMFALNENISKLIEKYNLDSEKTYALSKFVENISLREYISNNYSDYINFVSSGVDSVEEFIKHISSASASIDIGEAPELEVPDFIDSIKEALSNAEIDL